jgi:hypothetical protein
MTPDRIFDGITRRLVVAAGAAALVPPVGAQADYPNRPCWWCIRHQLGRSARRGH